MASRNTHNNISTPTLTFAPPKAPPAVSNYASTLVQTIEFQQFLTDVITAAGLVTHGKQCKALGVRLSEMVVKLRASTIE